MLFFHKSLTSILAVLLSRDVNGVLKDHRVFLLCLVRKLTSSIEFGLVVRELWFFFASSSVRLYLAQRKRRSIFQGSYVEGDGNCISFAGILSEVLHWLN